MYIYNKKKMKKQLSSFCTGCQILNPKHKINQFYRRATDYAIGSVKASLCFIHNFMLSRCMCCKPLYKKTVLFELVFFYTLIEGL